MLVTAVVLLLSSSGCRRWRESPDHRAVEPPEPVLSSGEPEEEAILATVAEDWLARAADEEPAVTALMRELATAANGELSGLEHRMKTPSSMRRKLEVLMLEEPELEAEEIVIFDALRYTLVIDDEPPGRHEEAASATLRELEKRGHTVVRVRNYWPAGDSYSGVNVVLRTPRGFEWELQFHTPTSYAIKSDTHDDYEIMRALDTPLEQRRRLFAEQSAEWRDVPVPSGILDPPPVHRLEEIVTLSPP